MAKIWQGMEPSHQPYEQLGDQSVKPEKNARRGDYSSYEAETEARQCHMWYAHPMSCSVRSSDIAINVISFEPVISGPVN